MHGYNAHMAKQIIAVTGSTGFVGRHLCERLTAKGYQVIGIKRQDYDSVNWMAKQLTDIDGVVNLAGAPILRRWSSSYRRELIQSRVGTTKTLIAAMGKLPKRPKVLVSASAVGVYTDGRQQTESHYTAKRDFLGNLCLDWERAAATANSIGVRTAMLRIGVVLGKGGGMMKTIGLPFKLGLGGIIGSGKQGFSWIHLDDLCDLIIFLIEKETASGIYNGTAPQPVTNRQFTRGMGRILGRPTLLPVPEFALKLLYGQGARVITSGQLVYPERALQEGFKFTYPDLKSALKQIFGK